MSEEDLNEIQKKLSHAMVLYPIQRERDFNRGIQKSIEILNAHYKNNKYGYWIWRGGAWICNKCGQQNRNLPEDETISVYWTGDDFVDLCRGPHVENSKELLSAAFQIKSSSGAYWRGDENRDSLQRIYVYAFPGKDELKKASGPDQGSHGTRS